MTQLAEAFATKVFALSYGFASVDVHSGCGVGDFVHKYTHRYVHAGIATPFFFNNSAIDEKTSLVVRNSGHLPYTTRTAFD
jgi:hypothetical protein